MNTTTTLQRDRSILSGSTHPESVPIRGALSRLWTRVWRQWSFDDSWLLSEANRFERELDILVASGRAAKDAAEIAKIREQVGDARCSHLDRQARWAAIHHAEEMSLCFVGKDRLVGIAERLVHVAESENFPPHLMSLIRHLSVQAPCASRAAPSDFVVPACVKLSRRATPTSATSTEPTA